MAWQNLHVTLEITSQSTNGWRLENSTTGRVSVADGTYLFETFPAQGLAAGGPLDPAGDRDATVHAVIDGAVTTVYWLDAENMFPLQIRQAADGSPLITLAVLNVERAPLDDALFALPADLPDAAYVRRTAQ